MSEVTPSRDMAEEGKRQTPDLEKDEADSTNPDEVAACEEHKPTGLPAKVKQQSPDDGDSAENNMVPPTVKCSGDDKSRENSSLHGADKECSGDHNRKEEQPAGAEATTGEGNSKDEKEEPATKTLLTGDGQDSQADGQKTTNDQESSATNQTSAGAGEEDDSEEGNKPPAASILPNSGDRQDDQADGPIATNDEPSATNQTNTGAGEDKEKASASDKVKDTSENTVLTETASQQSESLREESDQQDKDVEDIETIGPTIQDIPEPKVPGGIIRYVAAVCIVVFVAILVQHLLQPESPPQKKDVRQIDVFLKQMEKVKTGFPHQRAELWNRARIHLQRHLLTAQPTEPVSLILTAGLRAERTLHCLAQGLASAFSAALNASVLHIDGASKASEDSDQVKLDIDSKLQGAFEGDKPVAVIHRFEELPPGSTLIFYRYCDHENAAYKKTFLIFTVLLGEEEEIPAKIRLSAVEEMVDDHLQKKFLTHGRPVSFDRMDLDKYGGLWSRISHLILPVAAEERIEHEGC